jgi:hypothetical protein
MTVTEAGSLRQPHPSHAPRDVHATLITLSQSKALCTKSGTAQTDANTKKAKMIMDTLGKLDPKSYSSALQRFALGAAWGIVMALGMWLISTLSHNENYGLVLTWQFGVEVVLFMGLIQLVMPHKKKQSPSDKR